MSRAETEARLREALGRAPAAVVCAYLFGSVARGEARSGSDVDVALLFEKPPEAPLDAVVHGYADVDLGIVENAAGAGLADLERFVSAVRERI